MISEQEALLRAVLERPEDDLPRLILADYLEETGEPANVARAESMRIMLTKGWTTYNLYGGVSFLFCLYSNGVYLEKPDRCTSATVSRGFISRIECTLAEFMGGELCQKCDGDGHTGDYPAGRWSTCKPCNGTGRTPGLVDTIFAEHPVTEVVLTDVEIAITGSRYWIASYETNVALMQAGWDISFPSIEAAQESISQRCVNMGRRRAGLKPTVWGNS